MAETVRSVSLILNSWKEIASHMGRGVRTVQRWERELNLPVHRIGGGRRSPVYAYATELNFWRATSGITGNEIKPVPRNGAKLGLAAGEQPASNPVEQSRRLLQGIHSLVQTVAETSVRQRRETETLQKRLLEMRARLKRTSSSSR